MTGEPRYVLPTPGGREDLGQHSFVSQFGRLAAGSASAETGAVPDLWAHMTVGSVPSDVILPSLADIALVRASFAEIATPGVAVICETGDGTTTRRLWYSLVSRTMLPAEDVPDEHELVLTRGVVRFETTDSSFVVERFTTTGPGAGTITGPDGTFAVSGPGYDLLATWGQRWMIEPVSCLEVFASLIDHLETIIERDS